MAQAMESQLEQQWFEAARLQILLLGRERART